MLLDVIGASVRANTTRFFANLSLQRAKLVRSVV